MALVVLFAVWASATDARRRRLPNRLLGPMFLSALCCQLLRAAGPRLLRFLPWLAALDADLAPPATCCLLAMAVAVALTATELLHRKVLHGPGLGFGDVKLAAIWTLALGSWGVVALAVGCGAGGLHGLAKGEATFPLGPYVTSAALSLALLVPILS